MENRGSRRNQTTAITCIDEYRNCYKRISICKGEEKEKDECNMKYILIKGNEPVKQRKENQAPQEQITTEQLRQSQRLPTASKNT